MTATLKVFLPLLIAYGVTLGWVVDRWNAPTQYYQHGWLLPLVAGFVIWARRDRWTKVVAISDPPIRHSLSTSLTTGVTRLTR